MADWIKLPSGKVANIAHVVEATRRWVRWTHGTDYNEDDAAAVYAALERRAGEAPTVVPDKSRINDGHPYKPPVGLCAVCGVPRYFHLPPPTEPAPSPPPAAGCTCEVTRFTRHHCPAHGVDPSPAPASPDAGKGVVVERPAAPFNIAEMAYRDDVPVEFVNDYNRLMRLYRAEHKWGDAVVARLGELEGRETFRANLLREYRMEADGKRAEVMRLTRELQEAARLIALPEPSDWSKRLAWLQRNTIATDTARCEGGPS